jgi:FlaG/FlaF family flagellin (archaellin)
VPPKDRATTHTFAVVTLVAVTVALAAAVGVAAVSYAPADTPGLATLTLAAEGDCLELTHEGGAPLDVRDLRLRVEIDGVSLAHQPPVPFFAARGFAPGPTGPLNVASDPRWTGGETGSFCLAETNRPTPSSGATVSVTVSDAGRVLVRLETRIP